MATAVVLNGTSSSGKTTVARVFQKSAPELFLNFSIDTILYALPEHALERMKRGDDISDLRLPDLVRAFYACVRQLLQLGHNVVLDHAVTAPYHVQALLNAVESHDTLLVGLDCPVNILRERETRRADRRIGLAEQQQRTIHSFLEYDVRIDTSTTTPVDAAAQVVVALGNSPFGAADRVRAKSKM